MKYLVLFSIQIYWKLIPASRRKHCLFKESCSNAVFRVTLNKGLKKGLRMFRYRYENCRPGYTIQTKNNQPLFISAKGVEIPWEKLSMQSKDSIIHLN
ncbi:membrane protein insertion efficiency factor YidD [Flavobacteriaceae bacterium TK19130]|nr:membrane protein insertion efficiency factor YidD [Thermobacterium salinum]